MLKFLSIKNLAVISHLSFSLHEGLSLLTGETGAGKSIIVDALGLLLGGRGGVDLIRTGERSAAVEGHFELGGGAEAKVREVLEAAGLQFEKDEELLIRREIQESGRSRIFVNNQSVTASTLKSLQPYLLEILGQGEQHSLSLSRSQLEMLDSFAACEKLRAEVASVFDRWKSAVEALRALEINESERERVSDYLRYQIAEIEKAALQPNEDTELASEKALLAHAEKAFELCAGGYAELYESDQSVLSRLSSARKRVQELHSIDGRVAGWLETLETAALLVKDVAEGLRDYGDGVDFSPERLNHIESRLAELERLKRKYGRDLEGLIALKEELRRQLSELGSLEEKRGELSQAAEAAAREYLPLARKLSGIRRAAARRLEERVSAELGQLSMEGARFRVSFETGESEEACENQRAWAANGIDRVEFLLSANVGEDARPLSRVASGGELSRLMLTLRIICGGADAEEEARTQGATMVFDEIDTGIGGMTADAVGRRLKILADRRQVLCVTHQPQIARYADHHYVVSKEVEGSRTLTKMRELEADERVGELARMIGGAVEEETTRATARWMLENRVLKKASGQDGAQARRTGAKAGAAKRRR
ncbi:MAG TPA: DNA repair protein RecN [Pyrinomonadaceae bacterium]|nr:DNA repair protein RecN [Pyrinomonadaceae bacterium]